VAVLIAAVYVLWPSGHHNKVIGSWYIDFDRLVEAHVEFAAAQGTGQSHGELLAVARRWLRGVDMTKCLYRFEEDGTLVVGRYGYILTAPGDATPSGPISVDRLRWTTSGDDIEVHMGNTLVHVWKYDAANDIVSCGMQPTTAEEFVFVPIVMIRAPVGP